jgi:hypothetical protein
LAALGYSVVGVEHDPLRLGITEYVFSQQTATIQPFVLETCKRIKEGDNVVSVTLPDISIDTSVLSRISIDARAFFDAAAEYETASFACIVTCFFLDCESVDLTELAQTCKRLLSPGGVWINCGPLNYHYGGSEKPVTRLNPKRELSLAEVKSTISSVGFTLSDESEITSTYLGNAKTMMDTLYKCQFFSAVRC